MVAASAASVDAGAQARQLFDAGRYDEAEYVLWEVLRTSPRAPTTTYLLGVTLLFTGRYAEGRRLVERAYELRHWLDDRILSPNVRHMLVQVGDECPDWDWVPYQLLRERWRAVGLDLSSAIDHLAEIGEGHLEFVQIGANDGRSGDPLRRSIERHEMSGIFVEPQPGPCERLKERYSGVPGLRFAQLAVAESDGPVTLFTDPSRTTLGTLVPDRNIMRDRTKTSVELTVEGCTFESFSRRYDITKFDVLQLDTEGFDFKILQQVPLDVHGVSVINMEYFCLSIPERLAAGRLLEAAGFACFFTEMDLLAVRRDSFTEKFCITSART